MGLTNLQSLDLAHNKLTHLGPNLFTQLHRLTDLDLSANSIGSIHRLAFQVIKTSCMHQNEVHKVTQKKSFRVVR